jgi:hypothetical protein
MMQGCHPLSEHRNAGQGRGCAEVSGQWKRLEKRSLRRRGSSSLNWTFTHERLRMIHQRRRRGTLKSDLLHFQPGARSRSKPCI